MSGYSTQFGTDLLNSIGAPLTSQNYTVLAAWAQAEGGNASYNPFNTTQKATGAGSYNSVGVRNYTSYQQGLTATVQTLNNGNYPGILSSLKQGTSAQMTAQAIASSPWGTGTLVEQILGAGGPSGVPATTGGQATTTQGSSVSSVPTKTCYWSVSIPLVGSTCLDPLLWLSLALVGAGTFVLGGALMALSEGHGKGGAAESIVQTIGPAAVAGKVAGRVARKAAA